MNLAGKPPLGMKERTDPRDPDHLARVRELPCVICHEWGMAQRTPTEAHHCIHGRYSQRRTPDRMAIPLCHGHHQGAPGIVGLHSSPAAWKRLFGEDHAWIPWTLDRLGF